MRPADWVAFVLAVGLSLSVMMILIVTAIQILDHMTPDITLSENATQIMIAGIGGLIGLLGAYIGVNKKGE